MNSKTKVRTGIGKLCRDPLDKNSEVVDDDSEKANILSKYFSSVLTVEPDGPVPVLEDRPVNKPMPALSITTEKVLKLLEKLKTNKTPGLDEISPLVLKEIAPYIAEAVTEIFKKSLAEAALPSDWKSSVIAAIFKKGLTTLASNYRPVALTSILCKVLETLVRDSILEHLVSNNLLSKRQYGFLPKRSTTLQLLKVIDEWSVCLERGEPVDAIYTDFQKAFDKVPHKRLLSKLKA